DPRWPEGGLSIRSAGEVSANTLAPSPDGGAFVAVAASSHVEIRKYQSDGTSWPSWITLGTSSLVTIRDIQVVPDGLGGVYVGWNTTIDIPTFPHRSSFASTHHLDANGVFAWVDLWRSELLDSGGARCAIAPDGVRGVLVLDWNTGSSSVLARRFAPEGGEIG